MPPHIPIPPPLRNEGHSPVITGADDGGDTARSSGVPGTSRAMTGWRTRVNRKAILFIYWFPDFPVIPAFGKDDREAEDDGVEGDAPPGSCATGKPRMTAWRGTPRRGRVRPGSRG